ncbi:cat eye syndrome chromosome region, candidate 2 [Rhizopus azygosporus]|uniref:Cat eye syndrome chromosome region, candidate 2 n=1 Tax=Rhizopus azygosporus TaxID=86630 RepID=A0A367JHD5_RHIAZ|nr:cat eye syndrome chromosome region, candidate 2 [Rhizopus azygosporus]
MPARKTNKELLGKEASNDFKGSNKTNRSIDKLTISVTEDSSPEQILRSSWLFLSTFQFFFLFQDYFELSSLNIEQLENAMMQQDSNEFLKQFMCHVLTPLLNSHQRRAINPDNYEQYLFTLFPEFGPKFQKLHIVDRIQLLKRIEEAHLENSSEDFLAWKNSMDVNELRVAPLGKDDAGWSYWYFGNARLYREIPVSNGKKGLKEITDNQFTFELVCSNLEDWERIVESFRTTKRKTRELSEKIIELGEEVIAKIKSREAAKLKQEARLKRAKELEQIPKKRSRRLEAKASIRREMITVLIRLIV